MNPLQGRLCIDVPLHQSSVTVFSDNEIVPVRILSLLKDGTARIAVKGQILHAKASSGFQEGAFLFMQVRIIDDTVVLSPSRTVLPALAPHLDVFSQLGIPPTRLAAILIDLFRHIRLPLQARPLLKILSSLQSFTPHEKEAAFAASLLYSHGIEPSAALIEQCFTALFGFPAGPQAAAAGISVDPDFFRFINHVKSGSRHWVVFPFEKDLGIVWKGSAAFLLDLRDTLCLECCVRLRDQHNSESWVFTLKNGECLFSCQGKTELSLSTQERLTQLLRSCFMEFGAGTYTIRYKGVLEPEDSLASIDISV